MAKSKKQASHVEDTSPSPSTSAIVVSGRDAQLQESLRHRIDKLPRSRKTKPGKERRKLWRADPGLQDQMLDFIAEQRAKGRTRAELAESLGVNPTMVTRLENERQEARGPQRASARKTSAPAEPAMQLTAPRLEEPRSPQESLGVQSKSVAGLLHPPTGGVTYFIAENEIVKHGFSGLTAQDVIQVIDHLIKKRVITPIG